MIPRIRRLNISAIDFSKFDRSSVFWLGAGPLWSGNYRDEHGGIVKFLYRLSPAIYIELKRHHDEAHDRRLIAEPPPPRQWWIDGIRAGAFAGTPVMPSGAIFAKYADPVRKTARRAA